MNHLLIDQKKEEIIGWAKHSDKSKIDFIKMVLNNTLKKIRFLESIYMTGAENNHYSRELNAIAVKEHDEFCIESSACYSLLREMGEIQ